MGCAVQAAPRHEAWFGLQTLEARLFMAVDLLPDLIVWESEENEFIHGWMLDTNEQPGRTLLRLTTAVANIGTGALEIRGADINPDGSQDVFQRIYDDEGGFTDRFAGAFIFHESHEHIHYEGFAQYSLHRITEGGGVGEIVAGGNKTSFCLVDALSYDLSMPGAPSTAQYDECEAQIQGISAGWGDVYELFLPDQWIDVTEVPDGQYWLEVIVDPNDRLLESDETNNVIRIQIDLIKGSGGPTDDHGDDATQATAVVVESTTDGAIEALGDVDWFGFTAQGGTTYALETQLLTLQDSVLKLFDTDGVTPLAFDDDAGPGLGSRIEFTAPTSGTYYLEVAAFNNEHAGTYQLTVAEFDNRPTVTLALGDVATVTEFGGQAITFTVTRTGSTTDPLTVLYSVAGGATNGSDYVMLPGTVTIAAGQGSGAIVVTPIDDAVAEPPETLPLTLLANAAYIVGAASQAQGTILDGRRVAFDSNTPLVYTDAQGQTVTVRLTKGGNGFIEFSSDGDADAGLIELNETTPASTLKLSVAGKGAQTTIGDIVVNGSLKSLAVAPSGITGNVSISGTLGSGVFGDFADDHLFTLGGEGATPGSSVKLVFGRIAEADILSAIPIASFTAIRWDDDNADVDVLRAPRLDKLLITGDKKSGEEGDFEAGVQITGLGTNPGEAVLGKATIAGRLGRPDARVAWDIDGMVKSLTAMHITGMDIDVLGGLGSLTVKQPKGSRVPTFVDSNVTVGDTINKIKLGVVQHLNGGQTFGITAPSFRSAQFVTMDGVTKKAKNSILGEEDFLIGLA